MTDKQLKLEEKARQYVAICRRGFENQHAHKAWMMKRILDIQTWPENLRFSVVAAWVNSGPKEASKASPPSGGPK